MGLLDGVLGQVLSGALRSGHEDTRGDIGGMRGPQGGQGMGGLESILGGLAGGLGGAGRGAGAGPSMGAQGGGAALIAILLQLLQQRGGLGGLLSQFQQAGYGKQADSWVSTGGNQPITGDVLSKVLGSGELDRIAEKLGLPRQQAADQVASALPEVVDRMTPQGSVPSDSDALVNRALEILQGGGR